MPDSHTLPTNLEAPPPMDVDAKAVMEAVTSLREEFEKKTIDHEKIDKIETFLNEQENKNQAFLAHKIEAETREAETKERIDTLEIELARAGSASDKKNYKDTPEYKALNIYCRTGDVDVEQKELLRTDSDVAGGFLTTIELDSEITRKITEISMIRSIARVRTISSKAMEIPIRDTILTANYEGEAESNEDSVSTYSSETLNTFRQSVNIPITMDMLQDAEFDMESEIMRDAGEAFAKGEGFSFINGDGVKKPAGFLADSRVTDNARTSETNDTITATDVILLTGDLKTGYNPRYVFNRRTLAFLRTLKADNNEFLWQPGLNGPVANTLNGFDYLIAEDMPDIADGAFPVAFADFQRGYTIVDRTGMSVIRDEFTQKKKSIVEFTINRWNYGQVTLPEAIKVLEVQ